MKSFNICVDTTQTDNEADLIDLTAFTNVSTTLLFFSLRSNDMVERHAG